MNNTPGRCAVWNPALNFARLIKLNVFQPAGSGGERRGLELVLTLQHPTCLTALPPKWNPQINIPGSHPPSKKKYNTFPQGNSEYVYLMNMNYFWGPTPFWPPTPKKKKPELHLLKLWFIRGILPSTTPTRTRACAIISTINSRNK